MILDSLNNTKKIECLHPLFKKAFDYLKSTDFSKVEDGKHELDGSRLYASVVSIFGNSYIPHIYIRKADEPSLIICE